jgi:hypothetical protein
MKKITLLLLLPLLSIAQSKITDPVSVSGATATILLNNTTQLATLTLVGPSDRWLACQFGSFQGGMESGTDVVYFNGTILVDARHNGIGSAPTADTQNDWTISSNTISVGVRTIVATRAFNSTDATDFDFDYFASSIGIAVAHGNSASFSLAYHGAANRIVNTSLGFTTLGVENAALEAASIYPNPSKGNFSIISNSKIEHISIYTLTGTFLKTIKSDNDKLSQINVEGIATGVYLIEIVGVNQKTWKKVIVE